MLPRPLCVPLCQQRWTGPMKAVPSKMNEMTFKAPDIRPQKPTKTIGVLLERWYPSIVCNIDVHIYLNIML